MLTITRALFTLTGQSHIGPDTSLSPKMKKIFAIALLSAAVISVAAKKEAPSEKAILTIDKTPTTVGEFEYLYNKNNSQQAVRQTPAEYMELFKIYKLKVADAIANGIDTTASFKEEYLNYRSDLAAPYFIDKQAFDKAVRQAYDQSNNQVEVSHIMFAMGQDEQDTKQILARIDSVRNVILSGQATFDEMAVRFSIDGMARRTGRGYMGWVSNNSTYPYEFVNCAFNTPVGEISEPVNSGFGYHLILPHSRRKASKEVLVEHILKLTQGKSEEDAGKQKAAIDSIYNLLTTNPSADFNQIAIAESEDPGSARQGGKLDWFGVGKMVPEFEQASMALAVGETSKPVKTAYGYHIIRKINERDSIPFEEVKEYMEGLVSGSEFMDKMRRNKMEELRNRFNEKVNDDIFDTIGNEITAAGDKDSVVIAGLRTDMRPVATYTGGVVTVADVVKAMPALGKVDGKVFAIQMKATFNAQCSNAKLRELEVERLTKEVPDFRNLANEYHDGILLYEISNRNVWEKASTDKNGLEDFFRKNRKKYETWTEPRFKGYIVFATSDSIAQGAKEALERGKVPADSSVVFLRKIYNKDIRVERVIAPKGKNEIVDHLAFNGPRPKASGKWIAYFPYQFAIISQPEEAGDVRGEVTSDYQNQLEKEWVERLKKQHKVKVNNSLLKTIKEQ